MTPLTFFFFLTLGPNIFKREQHAMRDSTSLNLSFSRIFLIFHDFSHMADILKMKLIVNLAQTLSIELAQRF